jgi:hypothetical protein
LNLDFENAPRADPSSCVENLNFRGKGRFAVTAKLYQSALSEINQRFFRDKALRLRLAMTTQINNAITKTIVAGRANANKLNVLNVEAELTGERIITCLVSSGVKVLSP